MILQFSGLKKKLVQLNFLCAVRISHPPMGGLPPYLGTRAREEPSWQMEMYLYAFPNLGTHAREEPQNSILNFRAFSAFRDKKGLIECQLEIRNTSLTDILPKLVLLTI